MMNSAKLILMAVWLAICTCASVQGQIDSNTQLSIIVQDITMLQNARQAGLPRTIDSKSTIYLSIRNLGAAKVSTQQVTNELVEWLFVKEDRPYTTEKITLIHVHPAASSLIEIGTDAIEPLKSRLTATITNDDAVLVLRCLQHIYKTDSVAQLQQLKSQAPSFVVRRAIEFVLSEPRETTGIQYKLEPES